MSKIILNPDKDIVNAIKNRLIITHGHCPCVIETEWNEDTVCPCKVFRNKKECHCGLYILTNKEE